jgi:hypothetical protein
MHLPPYLVYDDYTLDALDVNICLRFQKSHNFLKTNGTPNWNPV